MVCVSSKNCHYKKKIEIRLNHFPQITFLSYPVQQKLYQEQKDGVKKKKEKKKETRLRLKGEIFYVEDPMDRARIYHGPV